MRRSLFLLSLLLLSGTALSQSGDFILTHHAPLHSEIDNVNFQISADRNGIICVANRFGLLKYDGNEWDFYRTQSSAVSLAIDERNDIFIGCIGDFGKMDFVDDQYTYISLISTDTLSDHFIHTEIVSDEVLFLSERNLFAYSPDENQTTHIASGDYINGYVKDAEFFINDGDGNLLKYQDGKLATVSNPGTLWGTIQTSKSGNKMGLSLDGELFDLTNGEKLISQNDKLREAAVTLTDFNWVNDTLIACSTVQSGVIFMNMKNPNYFEITDYHSGLPDNEIHDLFADVTGGVWVAHDFGFTRIAPLFPAYSYTNFPGLEGNLIEAQRIQDDLWVTTSLGVYYFKQDTSYRNRVMLEKKQTPQSVPQKTQQTSATEDTDNSKGFLGGLFKKKNRITESSANSDQGFLKKIFSGSKEEVEYIRKVRRIITGISYQFQHVPGTDGKFRQMIETPSNILGASQTGIYEITRSGAELVIPIRVRYAYAIPGKNQVLISTEDGLLQAFELEKGNWKQLSEMEFNDVVLNIYSDRKGRIWLAGTSHIYEGVFDEYGFELSGTYEINNRFYDELSILERKGELYFINSQGYFKFVESENKIVRDSELGKEIGLPHHHLHNELSRVWVFDGKSWKLLVDDNVHQFNYLGIYPDLKYLSYDEKLDRYWLITGDNQLLAYRDSDNSYIQRSHQLFVKRIFTRNSEIKVRPEFKLKHDENYISIEILKPDYLKILSPEYQYRLVGLSDEWSSWTHANLIDYSFIPPGDYELQVRSRDAFGKMDESKLLTFSVATPYWQQPWFYAIQILILGAIITITSRLNEDSKTNRILKSGLSILTLVVIIEFLQSVLGSLLNIQSTPVVDFLIDVSTAIMVFPLEWVLRKLWLEGGAKSIKEKAKKIGTLEN